MNQFLFIIIPILLVWSWILPIGFASTRVEGTVIQVRVIPILARIKRHGLPHGLVAATAFVLVTTGLASAWWLVATAVSFIAIVAMPQAYVVTTSGIRTGRGNFRRWTEFAGVYRSKAGARLQTISRKPDVPIWLSGDLGDDEFVHLLRTCVRESYKGNLSSLPLPQQVDRPHGDAPGLNGVAAFTQHGQRDIS